MTNKPEQLTDVHLAVKSELDGYRIQAAKGQATAVAMVRLFESIDSELSELQERRKEAEPELKPANLINKFYERYPLETFKSDSERAEALGYFMAGAELQCFGEFIKYGDLFCEE